jgi:hypothetical protein
LLGTQAMRSDSPGEEKGDGLCVCHMPTTSTLPAVAFCTLFDRVTRGGRVMINAITINKSSRNRSRQRCLKKFLYYFRKGYADPKYFAWERDYKETAHKQFQEYLNKIAYQSLLKSGDYKAITDIAVKIESRTNLLFSFEKMALRDAVKSPDGALLFATGLFDYLYGNKSLKDRFETFVLTVEKLPRRQTRVLTWPLVTVFGFIANPKEHIFLKPTVTKIAAKKYDYPFFYQSKPNWDTYRSLLDFAAQIKNDSSRYNPKDYIDLQSFIWVMGSEEYPD